MKKSCVVQKYLWATLPAVCLCLGLLAFTSCSKEDGLPKRIRVGYLPMVSSLTYFVAVENRYFIDEDIEIQATPIKTSNGIAQDLVAGNIDAAIELSIVPLLKSIGSDGAKFRVFSISAITVSNGFDGVLVQTNSPVKSLEDLSGKKVGTFPGTTAIATFSTVFANRYPGRPLPMFKPIDPSLHLQSLANGEVDAVHAYEPTLTIGVVEHGFKNVSASIYGLQLSPNPIGVAAVNSDWYRKNSGNKGAAKALFRALDRSVRFIETNPEEARRILAKYTGASPQVTASVRIMPMSESSRIDLKNLQQYLDILSSIKETTNAISVKAVLISE
jgi:ABC-type nitrate/sulfonate/bicarbonate transport system substrate-binding protein